MLKVRLNTFFRIPYLCKFRPGIPGISRVVEEEKEKVEVEKEEEEEEREPDLDNIESGDEMYGIEVELIQAGTPTQLIKSKLDSAPVSATVKGGGGVLEL